MLSGALESPYLFLAHHTVALASHLTIILTFALQPPTPRPSQRCRRRLHGIRSKEPGQVPGPRLLLQAVLQEGCALTARSSVADAQGP